MQTPPASNRARTGTRGKPVGRGTARNAILINLFVTPGMGSLMGGKILEGAGQLILAVAGVVLVLVWFVSVMKQYYGMMFGPGTEFHPRAGLGITGAVVFVVAWLWGLVTGINLMQEVRRREMDEQFLNRQPPDGMGSE